MKKIGHHESQKKYVIQSYKRFTISFFLETTNFKKII